MENEYTRDNLIWFRQAKHAVYYILGFIEIMLAFTLIFKLLGANPASGFAGLVYALTGIFAAPFSGIFATVRSGGYAIRSVFEPGIIIAMIVYALIAWGVISLLKVKAIRG